MTNISVMKDYRQTLVNERGFCTCGKDFEVNTNINDTTSDIWFGRISSEPLICIKCNGYVSAEQWRNK